MLPLLLPVVLLLPACPATQHHQQHQQQPVVLLPQLHHQQHQHWVNGQVQWRMQRQGWLAFPAL
jgi:outer membrane biogenesis lipoprotein LolB